MDDELGGPGDLLEVLIAVFLLRAQFATGVEVGDEEASGDYHVRFSKLVVCQKRLKCVIT
jgi:hypothetical protein